MRTYRSRPGSNTPEHPPPAKTEARTSSPPRDLKRPRCGHQPSVPVNPRGGPGDEPAGQRLRAGFRAPTVATKLAQGYDKTMASCILTLYRSAAQPKMAQLGEGIAAATQRPGLHLSATDDPFVGAIELQRRAAERAGARIEILDGLGHWWMVQDPQRGATALQRFWSSLDNA